MSELNRLMKRYKFAAASEAEPTVFGAARPGYSVPALAEWISFMQAQGIQRVCCLLEAQKLGSDSFVLYRYRQTFGSKQVCWSPIPDFHLASIDQLNQEILPFLAESDRLGQRVVVHCGGGIGRTGHVLAAWLVGRRGFSIPDAIRAVKATGRNPYEFANVALFKGQNPFTAARQLDQLLSAIAPPP